MGGVFKGPNDFKSSIFGFEWLSDKKTTNWNNKRLNFYDARSKQNIQAQINEKNMHEAGIVLISERIDWREHRFDE